MAKMGTQSAWDCLLALGMKFDRHPDNKEMLIMALTELGGAAHLDAICECYRRIRTTKRTDMAWKSEAQIAKIVSATLRRNAVGNQSSDVREGDRCFVNCEVGLGYWRLVSWVRYDKEKGRIVWDRA